VLVASGLAWPNTSEPPVAPDPWADGSGGRWRSLTSYPFAIADVPASSLFDGARPASIATTPLAARGPATIIRTDPGVRLAVVVEPLDPGPIRPATAVGPDTIFEPTGDGSVRTFLRRAPTAASDGTSFGDLPGVEIPLGGRVGSGGPGIAGRWSVTVATIDDVGDIADGRRFDVRRDTEPPAITLDAPVLSLPWPFTASLDGRTDPGATVRVDGGGTAVADVTGAFTLERSLWPWPQTLTISAEDPAGNVATLAPTVVGGIDYRVLPWPAILAGCLVAVALLSGLRGSRRRGRSVVSLATVRPVVDDDGPEMEELPPTRAR